mmetsp:Transcript_6642/g.10136  ORF Transcript_6642/g.10136 Transcript_6642/m.10136 type:complete len:84 (-) Transcript_6642:379-630(-)
MPFDNQSHHWVTTETIQFSDQFSEMRYDLNFKTFFCRNNFFRTCLNLLSFTFNSSISTLLGSSDCESSQTYAMAALRPCPARQ